MGTHSTVKFFNRNGRCILSLYNQYDGYYEGVGQELVDFFNNKDNYGNGFEDTALLYVCYKKQGKAYNTYLTNEHDKQEYNYSIFEDDKGELTFEIEEERWVEKWATFVLVHTLRYADFDKFKTFIEKGGNKEYDT